MVETPVGICAQHRDRRDRADRRPRAAAVRITDFAPRFRNFDRILRPPQLMRIIEPVAGLPRITIRVRPTQHYGEPMHAALVGQQPHHLWRADAVVRLTTDAPLSYIESEAPFVLTRPVHLVLGADEPFAGELATHVPRILRPHPRLLDGMGAAACPFSYEWQDATIRAAITLKLSSFEETGGIVAALTTSLPGSARTPGRNWDYRYCWLRDAYFVVKALNRIGATSTMEDFISFILAIAAGEADALQAGLWHRAHRPI